MKDATDRSSESWQAHGGTTHEGGVEGADGGTEATERMRRTLAAVSAGDGSSDELQTAARALVRDLRQHNEPPEKMLMKIKDLLNTAGLRSGFPADDNPVPDREAALYRDVIAWSIRAYYEER